MRSSMARYRMLMHTFSRESDESCYIWLVRLKRIIHRRHAHSDHYTNLSSSWTHGPIYCSVGTANLIKYKLGVKDEWVKPMPFDKPFEVAGCTVTLIDANQ